mmetsp:Transcript_4560/g.9878  ORF Transcript_4560/g.9878 Transcript_4560/m.9878 type:complete len:419 (-) Transcript_4560:115-1371(-)
MEEPKVEEANVVETLAPEEVTVAEVAQQVEMATEVPAAEATVELIATDPNEVPALVPMPPKKKRRSSGTVPRWTSAEEETLSALVTEHGERAWTTIADKLSNGRSAGAIDQHWSIMTGKRKREPKPAEPKEKKEKEEKAIVVKPMGEEGGEIVAVEGGDDQPKKKRERRSLGKAQRWTQEEEVKLKEMVNELGAHGHWTTIAERLGTGRSGGGVEQHWQIMAGRRKPRGSKGVTTAIAVVPEHKPSTSLVEVSAVADTVPTPVIAEASVATAEMATAEVTTAEMATTGIATTEIPTVEIATAEVATAEIALAEVAIAEVATAEVATAEISATEFATADVNTMAEAPYPAVGPAADVHPDYSVDVADVADGADAATTSSIDTELAFTKEAFAVLSATSTALLPARLTITCASASIPTGP